METNSLPHYDTSDNPTNCCPRFDPAHWDNQRLHFEDKLFLKAATKSILHMPTNMGKVFAKTFADIEKADARSDEDFIVLSHDPSNWKGEHYFAVTTDVPGQEMVRMTGDYLTKVFEGPFKDVPKWENETESNVSAHGEHAKKIYYFYTTCPKCAKVYGKNYVVAVAETEPVPVSN